MIYSKLRWVAFCSLVLLIAPLIAPQVSLAADDEDGRRIEEVLVYGQRVESTVSDTSISITAMDAEFLLDMGIQGPDEMVNYIPATTRTDWDIKIRGVGRNFRGLGGDPGVGTYYNGIYSPDFGIAATEGGLYDIRRIEVLRGPQGTLYGRNSIGGVVNYVTNPANHDEFESQIRVVAGQYNTAELYGVASGPITEDLAFRFTGVKRTGDGRVDGLGPSQDTEGTNDQNFALVLDWNINDKMTLNLRANDRRSLRVGNFGNGGHGIISEGPCINDSVSRITSLSQCDPQYRVARDTNYYAPGLRIVDDPSDPAAVFPYRHPVTSDTVWAGYNRAGVDQVAWPFSPSPNYNDPWVARYDGGDDEKPEFDSLTNNFVDEEFDHQAVNVVFDWDISDQLSIKYLGNYQSFKYWFDRDNDFSSSKNSSVGDTVVEAVWSKSHELRVFWSAGERWTATSGLYYFKEDRDQHYGIRNRLAKGYVVNPAQYGPDSDPDWVLRALPWLPGCFDWMTADIGAPGGFGAYCGDPGEAHNHNNDTGAVYEHDNNVINENIAFYTQGDYQITDTLSVTLGIRYSEDERDALEARGGYSEIIGDAGWLPGVLADEAPAGFDTAPFTDDPSVTGVTPLAALNVAMGAATFTGDPANPISPTCPLDSLAPCSTPLRLNGLPISWGSRARGKYETDSWTYRINFNWEPTEEILIYAGVTSGYRAGGFNMGGTDNRVVAGGTTNLVFYDDEKLKAYEIGYKGTHFDGRLQLTAAVYYYDYEDYQDHIETWESSGAQFALPPGIDAPAGRGPVEVTDNIPKATNKGFEVDFAWLTTDALTVGGNYSYTISEYDVAFSIFNEDDPRYPRAILGGDVDQDPCTLPQEVRALYCIEVDGVQLSGIPKHKATMWASYRWLMDSGTLTWYGSVSYTGDYFTNTFARPWDEVPERYRTDMRLSFDAADQKWSASVFVDNVFDDTYLRWSDMEPRRTGYGSNFPQRVVALAPRYVGVEFVYNIF